MQYNSKLHFAGIYLTWDNRSFLLLIICFAYTRFSEGKECKTNCNLSCSNHSTDDVPAGVWHCFQCLNNKMRAGACSLPGGVEGIWNAREVEVSDAEGLGNHCIDIEVL